MAYTDRQSRIFTAIAYMDLEHEYFNYCDNNGTERAPLSEILSDSQYEELKLLGISDDEINSWNISGIHDTNKDNGFYACIIETAPGEAAIGFRGSESMGKLDNVVNDWVGADLGLVNSTCTNQQEEVERFLEKYKDLLNNYESISAVGHSLGGNLAEYATIISYKYGLDDNIKQCVSMDGPGYSLEFINKYREQIEKMSNIMYHPRWSFVGTMLNDLPGVRYQYVEVSNDANDVDDDEYSAFTRHSTKFLVIDDNGNLQDGSQDALSMITSVISEGVDHLPSNFGNVLITIVGSMWIDFTWIKQSFFDEDGSISDTGLAIIASVVGLIMVGELDSVIIGLIEVVVAILAVLIVALVTELIHDLIIAAVDIICDAVAKLYNWASEKYQQFKEMVNSLINKAMNWLNNNFNKGYIYASENPQIMVDTFKLRNYSSRIHDVNRRISNLDRRMDSLYWRVGLFDLWNLLQADLLTGYSWRLLRTAVFLNDTASDFDTTENELSTSL